MQELLRYRRDISSAIQYYNVVTHTCQLGCNKVWKVCMEYSVESEARHSPQAL